MKTVEVEFWTKIRVRRTIRLTDEGINALSAVSEPADEDGKQYIEEAYSDSPPSLKDLQTVYELIEETMPVSAFKIAEDKRIEQIKWRVISND